MTNEIVEIYEPKRLEKLEKKRTLTKRLLWGLGLAAFAVCVVLTALVNTRNIQRMLAACICISTVTAWIIVYFSTFIVRDARRELEHAANLAGEPRETVTGKITPLKLKVQIRGSVALRKIRVDTDKEPVTLNILLDRASMLPKNGELTRLYTVHGYIVAYEVLKP